MTDQTQNPPDGTPLPTVDTGASTADSTMQSVIGATEKPVEAAIIAAEPFLATPVVKQLFESVLDWVYGILKGVLGRLTGYEFVNIQEYIALKNAAQSLAALKAAQALGDPDAIEKANADTDSAVTPILQYIGSVQPK